VAPAQPVGVVDRVGAGQHRERDRERLGAGAHADRGIPRPLDQAFDQLPCPEAIAQRRRQEESRIGDQARVVECDLDRVEAAREALLGCHHSGAS
jgi:hypothetical protein